MHHGVLDGVVALAGSDAPWARKQYLCRVEGLVYVRCWIAEPEVLTVVGQAFRWRGSAIDPLTPKPWAHQTAKSPMVPQSPARLVGYEPTTWRVVC